MLTRFFGLGLLLVWLMPALANDTLVSGKGGAPKLMSNHPSVRMVSEEVFIRLRPIVKALGGTMKWDKTCNKFIITMPLVR